MVVAAENDVSIVLPLLVLGVWLAAYSVRMEERERLAAIKTADPERPPRRTPAATVQLLSALGMIVTAALALLWRLSAPSGAPLWGVVAFALFGVAMIAYALRMDEEERRKAGEVPRWRAGAADYGIGRLMARKLPLRAMRVIQLLFGIGISGLAVAWFFFE